MSKVGVEETKKLIVELGKVTDDIVSIVHDGISFGDLFKVFGTLSKAKGVIEQLQQIEGIKKEIQDLEPQEVVEIGEAVLLIIKDLLD